MSVTKTLNGCNMDTLKCFVHNSLIQILTLYQLCHSHLVRVHAADKNTKTKKRQQTTCTCRGRNVGNHVCVPLHPFLVKCIILSKQPTEAFFFFWQKMLHACSALELELTCLVKQNIKNLGVTLKFVSICYTQSCINKELKFWVNHSSIILPFLTDIIISTYS